MGKKAGCSVSYRNQKVRCLFPEGAIRAPHVVHPPPTISHRQPRCKPYRPTEQVKRQQQCEQYGTVRTLRTGTSAIRSVHNGSARVAQVVVCHGLCAAREIEWREYPQSWQSPKHVFEKPLCVCVVCVWEKEKNRSENEPFNVQMRLSLIICIFTSAENKFKFYSDILL